MPNQWLSTPEVAEICKVKERTVRAWRRGYYWGSKGKTFFFEDKSSLPAKQIPSNDGYRWLHEYTVVMQWLLRLRSK